MNSFEPKPFGDFFLIDRIGQGGMAEVYLATPFQTFPPETPRTFSAIKKLLPHYSSSRSFVKHLFDEAKIVSLLNHPFVTQVLTLGNVGMDFYLEMEWVRGKTLHQLLEQSRSSQTSLAPEIVFFIATRIAEALGYAHQATDSQKRPLDLIHRDVSPHNILLGYDGTVKLTDFGITTTRGDDIQGKTNAPPAGKLLYMAPEVIQQYQFDASSDFYSLSVVLFEALTLRPPFETQNALQLQEAIQSQIPNFQREPLNKYPEIQALLSKGLSKNPSERPHSTSEFLSYFPTVNPETLKPALSSLMNQCFQEEQKKEIQQIQYAMEILSQALSISQATNPGISNLETPFEEPMTTNSYPQETESGNSLPTEFETREHIQKEGPLSFSSSKISWGNFHVSWVQLSKIKHYLLWAIPIFAFVLFIKLFQMEFLGKEFSPTLQQIDLYPSIQGFDHLNHKNDFQIWNDPNQREKNWARPLQNFFIQEYQRFSPEGKPLRIVIHPPKLNAPPVPWQNKFWKKNDPFGFLSHFFSFPEDPLSFFSGKLFVHMYSPVWAKTTPYPSDYPYRRPARRGIIFIPFSTENKVSLVRIAHEIGHVLKAQEKFEKKGVPSFPKGYVGPHLRPLYPQQYGELMSLGVPLGPKTFMPLRSLDETRIGHQTASEIGWISKEKAKNFYESLR